MLCFDLLSRRLLRGGTKSLTYFSSTPPYAGRAIPVDTHSTLYQSSRRQQRRLQFKPNSHLRFLLNIILCFDLLSGRLLQGGTKGSTYLSSTPPYAGLAIPVEILLCTLEGNRTLLQQNHLSLNDNVKLAPPSIKTTI